MPKSLIDVQGPKDRASVTLPLEISESEGDPVRLAQLLAKTLRRY